VKRWFPLLARQEDGTSLALFRIGVGLCLLHVTVPMLLTGVHGALLVDVSWGGYRKLAPDHWLPGVLGGATPEAVEVLVWGTLACGVLLVLGLGGRLTSFVALQFAMGLFSLNRSAGGGHDRLVTNALWLLVLGNATATLALDAWLRRGRFTSPRPVSAWPRWLGVWQLVLMYTTTGLQKVGADWMPWGGFAALYKALLMPSWQRSSDMRWLGEVYPLTQAATVGTLIFEAGAAVWLLAAWYRHTRTRPGRLRAWCNRVDLRRLWALAGVGLHLGIAHFMDVGVFSWITLSFYACLWSPDEWRAAGRRLLRGVGGDRQSAAIPR
jgi:hypothetical protein